MEAHGSIYSFNGQSGHIHVSTGTSLLLHFSGSSKTWR